jgi:hypothetical protein
MIEMGLVVALGLIILYARCGWKTRLWINSHPLFMDVAVFAFLNLLHWGTFSGLMVAAVGALFCSLTISAARKWIGYIENGKYVPGFVDLRKG